ncbi:DnaJ [Podosphaera aphanis]|nr:DnaJ [Podosphaera aphanis]
MPFHDAEDDVDLYDLLGISPTASKTEIKKAYHKAALQHHPDKVSVDQREESEKKFKEVSQAYEILFDDEKRQLYDSYGMAAFDSSRSTPGMGGGVDLDDILSQMFGMGGASSDFPGFGAPPKPSRGLDEQQKYQVTLEELYKGKTVKFASTKNIICSHCKGSGGKEKAKPVGCERCKGVGAVIGLRSVGPGLVTQERTVCDNCSGSGKIFKGKDKCKKCKGKRVTSEKKVLEIYIARGSRDGEKIILEGEADQAPNQKPGDIVFTLAEEPHEVFQRYGDDLSAKIHVTLAEALTGFNRVVLKHLDGRGIQIQHPEGKIMRPGQVLKIEGEGMPLKKSDLKGNLYLVVTIDFPEDDWASNTSQLAEMKKLLPQSTPVIKTTEIDEVEFDPNGDLNDFGGQSGDQDWVPVDEHDEEDETTTGCAQQ